MASNTSAEVKNRWNKAHYKQVAVKLDKNIVEQWEQKIKDEGVSKAEFIRQAIQQYLAQ